MTSNAIITGARMAKDLLDMAERAAKEVAAETGGDEQEILLGVLNAFSRSFFTRHHAN